MVRLPFDHHDDDDDDDDDVPMNECIHPGPEEGTERASLPEW